ncbi:dTMP kinase [Brevibacillus sp. HD1.4A]|uniref:dTMP kinase n=1 Tax=Brevibacillus sp. HD1.4A TaxID=2738978 RepID=UPI00156B2F1C|nr:dTMP kinase [Brevibacillus sp. HD1.4A]NRQ56329.1 dTMP kinase [Brevibacillus sp. HD1.4A]
MTGKWITFEGIGGSGKSTQVNKIAEWLKSISNTEIVTTKEPGGTEVGMQLRTIVKETREPKLGFFTETMLFEADRHETIRHVVKPALSEGKIVLSDRGIDGTVAYQGFGRGIDLNLIHQLTNLATEDMVPYLTIFIDIPIETHLERITKRSVTDVDQFDLETIKFQEKVRDGFWHCAKENPERFRIVDGTQAEEEVTEAIKKAFLDFSVV